MCTLLLLPTLVGFIPLLPDPSLRVEIACVPPSSRTLSLPSRLSPPLKMSFPPGPISGQYKSPCLPLSLFSYLLPFLNFIAASALISLYSTNVPGPLSLKGPEIKSSATYSPHPPGLLSDGVGMNRESSVDET